MTMYEFVICFSFACLMVAIYCGARALARSIGKTIMALGEYSATK